MSRRTLGIFGLLAGGAALAWWRTRQDTSTTWPGLARESTDIEAAPSWSPAIVAAPGYAGGGHLVESYLQGRGIPTPVAKGVAAGVWAESLTDPTAVNPASGAYGIGQWLGSRKAELFRRYGSRPSMSDQLEFLTWELQGGDHGGRAVLAQSTAAGALDAYVRGFMRPAAGRETTGDLARGLRYLG